MSKNKIERITRKIYMGLVAYGGIALILNTATTSSKNMLTPNQAKEYIIEQQNSVFLRNKKIEIFLVDEEFLKKHSIYGAHCTGNSKHYLIFDKDNISKMCLDHELGHVAYSKTSDKKIDLVKILKEYDASLSNTNTKPQIKEIILYIYSPEEFFCNTYSLLKNINK